MMESIKIFLSNIYANAKQGEVTKMRQTMKAKVGREYPQVQSWRKLTSWNREDWENVGRDPYEDKSSRVHGEYRCIVYRHSEKLAIPLGIIRQEAGTPIRIVNNLPHSYQADFKSFLFHRFKQGLCSCNPCYSISTSSNPNTLSMSLIFLTLHTRRTKKELLKYLFILTRLTTKFVPTILKKLLVK